jgi:hypothetical protein
MKHFTVYTTAGCFSHPAPAVETDAILALAAIIREVDGNNSLGAAALAEAILSHHHSRWGHQPAPPAEGEVRELVEFLRIYGDFVMDEYGDVGEHDQLTRAAELLEQRHPAPVPVSERLPGAEDCTTNPRTGQEQWFWGWVQHDPAPYSGRWRMMRREWLADEATHWLPAHALPLPAAEVTE